ncbi:hypothetical protein TSOC_005766 [Tetrabaena socialis]|uniref:Ubiquinol-cytochrome c chaperone domain-containing protein n=1 Tax=Tetrabaena socialis TaxID=47790 RepID=A0A2J8A5D7_9CHLO|nr:hypothetical protein TSOC_005766 [Tetrabaena socialis]|eukprot:PNH07739.1 hypothetical protein TSOC_005766 [Tetrabaena socialis]
MDQEHQDSFFPAGSSALQQGAAGGASTSGASDRCCALIALGQRSPLRFLNSQASSRNSRIGEVTSALTGTPPTSLQHDRGAAPIPPDLDNPLGRAMIRIMGFESKRSKLLHGAQRLYEAVTEHVDSGVLQRSFQTGKVFWSSYVLLSLHVWIVIHRLRLSSNPDARFFRQRFYNQFQQDVEYRVYAAGVQVGVSKWLKKLEEHFYETAYDFDKVLSPGASESLADILLRKYYGGAEQHRADADLLASYMVRELQCLELTDEEAVLRGDVRFSALLAGAVQRAGVLSAGEAEDGAVAGGPAGPVGLAGPAEPVKGV